jgi:hypothetical protein
MKVIVSTELEDKYQNFIVVDSFKKVRDLNGVTTLIIHKPLEDDFNSGVFMAEFHNKGINQFVYINKEPLTTIKMLVKGLKGEIIEDEFYLDDEEELIALLEDLGVNQDENTSLAVTNTKIVTDFMQAFARGEERIKAPLYIEQVNQALNQLSVITQQQELQITEMGTTSIETFERASTIIRKMDNQRKVMEEQLQALADMQDTRSTSSRPQLGNSIQFFSPVKYTGNAKILFIREYSHCRYLTSFILGYIHHVHYVMNKRVKLIIAHQKGAGVSSIYKDMFTTIDDGSANIMSLYDSELVATNSPKKEIIKELLSKPCDLFVVVDRLYGKDDILEGRIALKLNAVGGTGDLKRFNLKAEDTIFTVVPNKPQAFYLPTVKDYVSNIDARYATYENIHQKNYEMLDDKVGLKGKY